MLVGVNVTLTLAGIIEFDGNSASSRITIESTSDGRRRMMLKGFRSGGGVSLKIVTAAFSLTKTQMF